MPLQKLLLRPGANRESTSLSNEGTWFEMDKVRFRSGYPEKIGGWEADTGTTNSTLQPPTGSFWGVARSLWNWITLNGSNLMGVGTNMKYYIQQTAGGTFYDITPIRATSTVAANAFTTVNGSTTVVVNDAGHGAQDGDFVTISGVVGAVNGIPAASLNREFRLVYIDAASYSITVTAPATSSGTTGAATFTYQISTGSDVYTVGVGWGAGGWSGVTKLTLPDEKGRSGAWYLKRQEQQKRYSLRYPLGAPTFRYEVDALRLGLQLHWPAVELQAFGICNRDGQQRAVLLTREIALPSLESFHYDLAPLQQAPGMLSRVGRQLLDMHASGWQHGALFPCHMFVDLANGEMQLIDFERARKRTNPVDAACADLVQLLRRADWLEPDLLRALLRPYSEQAPRVIAQLSRRFPFLVSALKESRT